MTKRKCAPVPLTSPRLIDIHPGDFTKTAQSPENDLVRPPHGDQAITPQFRKFTGNRLDGETKVVGDVEAPEWHVNLDRRYRVCTGSPRDIEEEGGDPLSRQPSDQGA